VRERPGTHAAADERAQLPVDHGADGELRQGFDHLGEAGGEFAALVGVEDGAILRAATDRAPPLFS
jgi:hypothetical protein